jgi:hypothetical protein
MQDESKKSLSISPVMASVFLPGMGQILLGKKKIGLMFLISTLTAIAVGIILLISGYLSYLDTIIDFGPNAEMPDIKEVMHLKQLIGAIVTAVIIHISSIIHTIFLESRIKKEELLAREKTEFQIDDGE